MGELKGTDFALRASPGRLKHSASAMRKDATRPGGDFFDDRALAFAINESLGGAEGAISVNRFPFHLQYLLS